MIRFVHKGNFNNIDKFLSKSKSLNFASIISRYGQMGVDILAAATPTDSGKTAESWSYEYESFHGGFALYWTNDNTNEGYNIAILINYGHGTGTGGYVESNPFISPAIRPVFEEMADAIWKEVTSL